MKYECSTCEKPFSSHSNLEIHMRVHTSEKPFECKVCGKRFSQRYNLKRHELIHTGEKPHACDECGTHFRLLSHLKYHKYQHNGKSPHKCEVCKKRFNQAGALKTHRLIHTGEKPHVCKICNKRFTQMGTLKLHTLTHSEEKPFSCNVCGTSFRYANNLKYHMLIHSGEKLFNCEICQKSFNHPSNLRTHVQTHKRSKPYKCSTCNKSFTQKGNLKTHMHIHLNDKSHVCKICRDNFTTVFSLQRHMYRFHSTDKRFNKNLWKKYQCKFCHKRIAWKASLFRHITQYCSKNRDNIKSTPTKLKKTSKQTRMSKRLVLKKETNEIKTEAINEPSGGSSFKTNLKKLKTPKSCMRRSDNHEKIDNTPKNKNSSKSSNNNGNTPSSSKKVKFSSVEYKITTPLPKTTHQCEICKKNFINKKNLRKHLLLSHKSKDDTPPPDFYAEEVVETVYEKTNKLNQKTSFSEIVAVCETPYQCNECDSILYSLEELEKHLATHIAVVTEQPEKHSPTHTTGDDEKLEKHPSPHTTVANQQLKKHPSTRSTNANEGLEKHHVVCVTADSEQTETSQNQLEDVSTNNCAICNKNFASVYNLQRHTVSKHGKKRNLKKLPELKYKCYSCEEIFKTIFSLRKHFKTCIKNSDEKFKPALNDKKYPCDLCKKVFPTAFSMRKHRIRFCEKKKQESSTVPVSSHIIPEEDKKSSIVAVSSHIIPEAEKNEEKYTCEICKEDQASLADLKLHLHMHITDIPQQPRRRGRKNFRVRRIVKE